MKEIGALWRVVVDTKYGSSWDGWCSNEIYGSYGMGLKKNIRREWGSFLGIPGSRLEMIPRFDSVMTCGMGIRHLRILFQFHIVLLVLKMLQWHITWSFLMVFISGI